MTSLNVVFVLAQSRPCPTWRVGMLKPLILREARADVISLSVLCRAVSCTSGEGMRRAVSCTAGEEVRHGPA